MKIATARTNSRKNEASIRIKLAGLWDENSAEYSIRQSFKHSDESLLDPTTRYPVRVIEINHQTGIGTVEVYLNSKTDHIIVAAQMIRDRINEDFDFRPDCTEFLYWFDRIFPYIR